VILSLIAASKAFGQRFQVSGSLSTKTGVAPRYIIGLAEAEKVMLWQITSSPASTPNKINPKCKAAVPALKAPTNTSCFKYCSKSCSKPLTLGPSGATQLVSKASCTYFCSSSPMCGEESQILLVFTILNFLQIYNFSL